MESLLVAALLALGAQEKIAWRGDYDAALQEAKKEKKYVLLHFSGSS